MKTKNPHRSVAVAALAAAGMLGTTHARAETFGYCDFSDVTPLTLNGSAISDGNVLSLTSVSTKTAGSAYETTPIAWTSSTSFSTSFSFELTPSTTHGEGISFIIQGDDPTALGAASGGIGYGDNSKTTGGISPSVEVEFDTFLDTWDPNDNHVAVNVGGDDTTHLAYGTPAFPMLNGGVLYAWIDYDAASTTLDVYLSQSDTKPTTTLVSTTIDIGSEVGASAYVGFTGATGTTLAEEDIDGWEFSTDGQPCGCGGDADCSGSTPTCDTTTMTCGAPVAMTADAGMPDTSPPEVADAAPPVDAGSPVIDSGPVVVDSGAVEAADSSVPPPPARDAGVIDASTKPSSPPSNGPAPTKAVEEAGDIAGGSCSTRTPGAPVPGGLAVATFGMIAAWAARRRRAR